MNRVTVFMTTVVLVVMMSFSYSSKADLAGILKGAETAINLFKKDVVGKLRKGFDDLTLEEEYYLGRAVSATILSQYKVYTDTEANNYLNTMGQLLVWSSSLPVVFSGFHFTLIESDEINAFAAPGGFIFVTTGLYESLENEEQLAAVLAHEIAHVSLQHGLRAIKKSNLTQAFAIIGSETAKHSDNQDMQQLGGFFGDSIDDIVNQLVVSGYSKSYEYAADEEALRISYAAGYNPDGLEEFLNSLQLDSEDEEKKGLFKTHPPAKKRLKRVDKFMKKTPLAGKTEDVRTERFASRELTVSEETG
jgi:predicted Zn-dependent protease